MENEMVWVNEGFVLNDAGHLIGTSFIDLRSPEDRSPITSLVRGCERRYALEDCETIMISKPARYQSYGKELILDVQEGLAKEEAVIPVQETAAQAARQHAVSDQNEALELLDSGIRLSVSEAHDHTERHTESLTFGKEWWILSASIRPDDREWDEWGSTLPKDYDHVSEIGQPAKFAQALAHMVAEQLGPKGQEGSLSNTTGGNETEKTAHKTQWVMHGPVVYVDSVYDTLDGITDGKCRIAASIFTKSREYAAQKEYRFVVLNEGADEETVLLQVSGMMKDALKRTKYGLVRHTPKPLEDAAAGRIEPPNEGSKPIVKRTTMRERSAQREEWRLATKGPDGQVLSSEGGLRESVTEKTVTRDQDLEGTEIRKPTHNRQDPDEHRLSTLASLDGASDPEGEQNDEDVVRKLAREEFEWDNSDAEEDRLAIPVRTSTGRVYRSFEEMLSDPTYPMSPMGKVWEEDANTADEIAKTYRAIDVLDLKMKDVKEQSRQDIASAGWYAMQCIRNIYARLGDIVDRLSI